ncbi:hypothetical protein [Saccharopolyspora tripterygii]
MLGTANGSGGSGTGAALTAFVLTGIALLVLRPSLGLIAPRNRGAGLTRT